MLERKEGKMEQGKKFRKAIEGLKQIIEVWQGTRVDQWELQ